ncbi:MAG: NAD(P)/FAD-dependent oxidoreductase [Candidatus Heimdallarchaeota archaeon]
MGTIYDAVIVGAGPAGCSAAYGIARHLDLKTLIIERQRFPRRKVCGGILTPITATLLKEEFDLKIPSDVCDCPKHLSLSYGLMSDSASGILQKITLPCYSLLHVRRELFDNWFLKQVLDSGVEVQWGCVWQIKPANDGWSIRIKESTRKLISSKYLVGADGAHSGIRKLLGIKEPLMATVRQDYYQQVADSVEPTFLVFYNRQYLSDFYAYIVPKQDGLLLGTGTLPPNCAKHKIPLSEAIRRLRRLARTVIGGPLGQPDFSESWRIPIGLVRQPKGSAALIGDAAGHVNAHTGEGIRFAIEGGLAVSSAIRDTLECEKEFSSALSEELNELESYLRRVADWSRIQNDESLVRQVRSFLEKN